MCIQGVRRGEEGITVANNHFQIFINQSKNQMKVKKMKKTETVLKLI